MTLMTPMAPMAPLTQGKIKIIKTKKPEVPGARSAII